jgi:hypothetical protein
MGRALFFDDFFIIYISQSGMPSHHGGKISSHCGKFGPIEENCFLFSSFKIFVHNNLLKGALKMKNGFAKEKLKRLLIEVRELMEIISSHERTKNQNLMSKYEMLFLKSLGSFNAGEVWRG